MSNDLQRLVWLRAALRDGRAQAIRAASGLSQGELATSLRVSRASVSSWEQLRRTPRGAAAQRYARLLQQLAAEQPPAQERPSA